MKLPRTLDSNCPVCYVDRDFSHTLFAKRLPSPRQRLVMEILLNIRTVGSFQVGSVKEFWRRFRGYLCSSCQMKLDSMGIYQQRALELLEEAVKLDPDNKIVKENLKKVKQMI